MQKNHFKTQHSTDQPLKTIQKFRVGAQSDTMSTSKFGQNSPTALPSTYLALTWEEVQTFLGNKPDLSGLYLVVTLFTYRALLTQL